MKYNYKKIDIYVNGKYYCSTKWSKTCREAVKNFIRAEGITEGVKANFSK